MSTYTFNQSFSSISSDFLIRYLITFNNLKIQFFIFRRIHTLLLLCVCVPELKVISRHNEFIVGIFAAKQCVTCFIGTTLHVFLNVVKLHL
jgi:hypothetical protein